MDITKTKKVIEERKELIGYICDRCHIHTFRDKSPFLFQEYLRIRFTGGYDSIFGDSDTFECDLCQNCVKEVLGNYLRQV